MNTVYNKFFFNEFYEENGGGNYLDREKWVKFFSIVAKEIVDNFNPKTVLDAGCACGYLVEELRKLGVEAYGIDISHYAINSANSTIKPYLNVQSITDELPSEFPEKFDLVVTMEVLEHLFPEEGRKAIELLCSYSDVIIFTSTPDDIEDKTHVNVQRAEYWVKEFALNSFYHDLLTNVDFICPWAMAFKRRTDIANVVFDYELNMRVNESKHNKPAIYKSVVYFDCGNGYNEENTIEIEKTEEAVKFNLPEGCKKFRLDPVDNECCMVSNIFVRTDAGLLEYSRSNAKYIISNVFFFDSSDSQIEFEITDNSSWAEIRFSKLVIKDPYILTNIEKAFAEIREIELRNENLRCENNNIIKKLAVLTDNLEYYKLENTNLLSLNKEAEEKNSVLNSNYEKKYNSINIELEHYKVNYGAAIQQRDELQAKLAIVEASYAQMRNSQFWKITKPLRVILDAVKKVLYKFKFTRLICKGIKSIFKDGFKLTWAKVRVKLSSNYRMEKLAKSISSLEAQERKYQEEYKFDKNIKFSILVPLYNTPINFLDEMIASVKAQTYPNWELCLADGSDKRHDNVGKEILKLSKKDSRIKYKKLEKNLGISENTNACIDMSTGDYIALFDHDDILHPAALFEVMKAICDQNADFIYTDEATFESPNIKKITVTHFKPDYAIDNLRANNYICHLTTFKKSLIDKGGKFRSKYDGSQDHDLMLRLTAVATNIVHIPKILYFWRSHPMSVAQDINSKTYAIQAGKNAVHDSIALYGYNCCVESSRAFPTIYRIKYEIKNNDLVSIIIPNKNHYSDLKKCINSILSKTTYLNYEIVIVDNGSDEEDILEYYEKLKKDRKFVICSLDINFNYSKLNNYAVTKASGKYYVLLNNDIEIITPEWIEELLMYVQREDVGAAGAMLYYPDDTIQHAGIVLKLGAHRVAGHAFHKCPRNSIGYMGRLCYAQNMSAVTAACMMVKSSVYEEVGGFDENFKVAYNDVDFCLKMRKKGYNIVWTPYCEAYHYESKSRGSDFTPEQEKRFLSEAELFKSKWNGVLEKGDPYYNPNFSLDYNDFRIKD